MEVKLIKLETLQKMCTNTQTIKVENIAKL